MGVCNFRCFYDIDIFSVISVMDILRLFSAEIKFQFIHTLILVWFDLTKV